MKGKWDYDRERKRAFYIRENRIGFVEHDFSDFKHRFKAKIPGTIYKRFDTHKAAFDYVQKFIDDNANAVENDRLYDEVVWRTYRTFETLKI